MLGTAETIENQTKTDLVSLACGESSPDDGRKKIGINNSRDKMKKTNVATFKCKKKCVCVRKPVEIEMEVKKIRANSTPYWHRLLMCTQKDRPNRERQTRIMHI